MGGLCSKKSQESSRPRDADIEDLSHLFGSQMKKSQQSPGWEESAKTADTARVTESGKKSFTLSEFDSTNDAPHFRGISLEESIAIEPTVHSFYDQIRK